MHVHDFAVDADVAGLRNFAREHKSDASYLDLAANTHGAERGFLVHRALGRVRHGEQRVVEVGPGGGAAVAHLAGQLAAEPDQARHVRLTLIEAPGEAGESAARRQAADPVLQRVARRRGSAASSVRRGAGLLRPDRDFLTTVECLRVRQRDGFAEITYKPASTADSHSATDIIAKPETNVILSGADQANAANTLLDVLGMVRLCRVQKTRTTFRHPDSTDITVVIDLITGVGAFAETEVMAADASAAAALLDQAEQQLGLADCPVVSLPYPRPGSPARAPQRHDAILTGPAGIYRDHCGVRSVPAVSPGPRSSRAGWHVAAAQACRRRWLTRRRCARRGSSP